MNSLLNEMKLDFKRGQKIKYFDHLGKIQIGSYIMASYITDHIVIKKEPNLKVIPVSSVWNIQ